MKEGGGAVVAQLTSSGAGRVGGLGGFSDGLGWLCGRMLSQRRDQTRGRVLPGRTPALQRQVRAGARGEREGRRAAPGRRRRRSSSCPPLLPRQRSPPADGNLQGTPPAPSGTAPGGAGGTAAEPPADEQPCCHLPPHSPPLPPHRPEVTRQGSDSAGTLHGHNTNTHPTNSGTVLTSLSHKCRPHAGVKMSQRHSCASRTGPCKRYL